MYSNATDYSPVDIVSIEYRDKYDVLSQELQFISSTDHAFSYTAGLYYYHQKAKTNRDVVLGPRFRELFHRAALRVRRTDPPLPAAGAAECARVAADRLRPAAVQGLQSRR